MPCFGKKWGNFLQKKSISADLMEGSVNQSHKTTTPMQYSKLASKLRGKIKEFSGYVSTHLDKTARRFIREALYGIMSSQSVMLTEIGRSLQTDVPLKKIEDRFCRQLGKEEIWQAIHRQVLADAAPRISSKSLLILDLSDLTKKYARKMQYLARVRDGSEGGELTDGYWTLQVIGAEPGSADVLPLYHQLYSQQAPEFISENTQIIGALEMVSQATGNRGIWVMDRGGDRQVLFNRLLGGSDKNQFIVRLVGDRHLLCGGKKEIALSLAGRCKTPYSETLVKEEKGKETVYTIDYGYLPVKLPFRPEQLWMLVVKGFGEKPMMLLTTQPLRRSRKVLWRVVRSYIKRWSIEETIRFVKQGYDLENIRLLTYRRLRNMMGLLLAVFYFLAVKLDRAQKMKIMTGHILKQAKRVFGIPDFKFYAMGDGLSTIFKRSPGQMPAETSDLDPMQLGFGFT